MPVNDFLYVKRCCELIEEKLQWGESRAWTKADFEKLSEIIRSASKISISSSTLKRLFGRAKTYKDFYNPQLATKNALAQFIGFSDWDEFRSKTALPPDQPPTEQPVSQSVGTTVLASENKAYSAVTERIRTGASFTGKQAQWTIWAALLVTVVGVGLFFYVKPLTKLGKQVTFTGKYLKGDAPLHATFYYDVSRLKTNNVYLETDRERILLDKKDHFVNYQYKVPNVYKARLITDDEELSELKVLALSQGWEGVIRNERLHQPISPEHICQKDGFITVSKERLQQARQDIDGEFWVEYANISDFNVDCDNYTLETQIKNNQAEGGIPCFDVEVEVSGELQKERVRFVGPQCSRWTRVEFGEVRVDGTFSDLPSLAQNLSEWSKIKLEVRHKTVRIYCKDKLVYTTKYQEPAGKAKGIILRFKGNGLVDYVRLYNSQQQLVYQDEFDVVNSPVALP